MSLWNIGAALDDVNVGLHQIRNLLQIYDEHIEDELEFIRKHGGNGVSTYFVDRYDLLRSLLEIIQLHAHNTAESLQKQIDAIYAASREQQIST